MVLQKLATVIRPAICWSARWFAALAIVFIASAVSAIACQPIDATRDRMATWSTSQLRAPVAFSRSLKACDGDAGTLVNAVIDTLIGGGIVVLGEVHDNGIHHQLRAELINAIGAIRAKAGGRAALVFEHLREDQQPILDKPPSSSSAFFDAVRWADSGWPDKALFAPLIDAVLATGWPILAGEPARGEVRKVAREGIATLSTTRVEALALSTPLPAKLHDALRDELASSHCGLLPKSAFAPMLTAQRFRDATLAAVARKALSANGSAIIFTGNGHAQKDRGVPFALAQQGFKGAILSVHFTEDEVAIADPQFADIVVATLPAERSDPCDAMRANVKNKT